MFALTHKVPLVNVRIVQNTTRARGGVKSESEVTDSTRTGEQLDTTSRIIRHVDHVTAVAKVDKAYQKVISTIKRFCRHTPLGWVCPEDKVGALETALMDAYQACADANDYAACAGSQRRVEAGIAYLQADWDDPGVIRLVYETVQERVSVLRANAESLPPGRLPEVRSDLLQLATMVGGPAREALEFAAKDVGRIQKARQDGRDPDFSMLDAAVQWFAV